MFCQSAKVANMVEDRPIAKTIAKTIAKLYAMIEINNSKCLIIVK